MNGKLIRKSMAVLFVAALCIIFAGGGNLVKAFTSDRGDGTFANPVIFSDVPDEDILLQSDRDV